MPNTTSAKKALKRNEKRRMLNRSRKNKVKTFINSCLRVIDSADTNAMIISFRKAQEQIQRAVTKGVMHKNTAARRISRLAKKLQAKCTVKSL